MEIKKGDMVKSKRWQTEGIILKMLPTGFCSNGDYISDETAIIFCTYNPDSHQHLGSCLEIGLRRYRRKS
jgi:hypothetical protein